MRIIFPNKQINRKALVFLNEHEAIFKQFINYKILKHMKKIILKTNHRLSNHFSKTFFILLMLGIYSTGHAMLGNPIGIGGGPGGNPIPIGSGGGDNVVPGDLNLMDPQLTPPCNVSNTCVETDKYIPVWRWNATSRVMDACPSPLFVRKDAFTCNRMLRINLFENQGTFGTSWINPSICPGCNIGFVGINAIQPEEQLHVIGNIKCQEGKFIGKISTSGIYGELQNDPDGIPYSGDEEYGTIEVQNSMNFNNGFTAGNATITDLSVSNLNAGNISTSSLTSNYLTNNGAFTNNGDLFVNGVLRVRDASGQNVFRVDQNGQIRARRTTVDLQPIPDYVFKKGYKLMPIEELESFVTKYNHLPKIKSEAEYQNAGEIDLGELNLKLLEKVEELTLYLIEQDKKIKALEAKYKKALK